MSTTTIRAEAITMFLKSCVDDVLCIPLLRVAGRKEKGMLKKKKSIEKIGKNEQEVSGQLPTLYMAWMIGYSVPVVSECANCCCFFRCCYY